VRSVSWATSSLTKVGTCPHPRCRHVINYRCPSPDWGEAGFETSQDARRSCRLSRGRGAPSRLRNPSTVRVGGRSALVHADRVLLQGELSRSLCLAKQACCKDFMVWHRRPAARTIPLALEQSKGTSRPGHSFSLRSVPTPSVLAGHGAHFARSAVEGEAGNIPQNSLRDVQH